jgi:hypothetical protein
MSKEKLDQPFDRNYIEPLQRLICFKKKDIDVVVNDYIDFLKNEMSNLFR